MKIIKLNEVDSTHTYLKEYIKVNKYIEPTCIITSNQTNGIASRGNSWSGTKGNMFFSFVMHKDNIPSDLPIQSASIYFSYILKSVLQEKSSLIWLKWPNDFFINNKKIGGTITTISNNLLYCGIGLNLILVNENFGKLDIIINVDEILNSYFDNLNSKTSWKEIFREFKIEFKYSKKFQVTIDNKKVSLENAILNDDGSVEVNNKKVFSLR